MSVVIFVCPVLAGGEAEMHTGLIELLGHLKLSREMLVDPCVHQHLAASSLPRLSLSAQLPSSGPSSRGKLSHFQASEPCLNQRCQTPNSRFSSLSHRG